MIITDKFVLLAFPKTGTTFTTSTLRFIHGRRRLAGRMLPYEAQTKLFKKLKLRYPDLAEVLIPRYEPIAYHKNRTSRHGACSDIPADCRQLPIVSVTRNPFSRYESAYLYRMKTRKRVRHLADPETLKSRYPNYPELTFEQYYDMMNQYEPVQYLHGVKPSIELGAQTAAFINFYFSDPAEVFRKISVDYIESGAYKEDMADIHFLHQENLRAEFAEFLSSVGYSESECAIIGSFERKNVARRDVKKTDSFFTTEITDLILKRDALLFKIFPEYLKGH